MNRTKKQSDLLRKLKDFDNQFPLATSSIKIPYTQSIQTDFLDSDESLNYYRALNVYSGNCFERIAAAIFGGYHHRGSVITFANGEERIQPDISDHKKRRYIEVKSCAWAMEPKLIREQVVKNLSWMFYEHSEPKPRTDYMFFRHNVKHMQKRGLTKEEYLKELRAEGILYGILMPISIPAQFFLDPEKARQNKLMLKEYDFSSKGYQRGYGQSSILSLSARFLNELVVSPEQTIQNLGLSAENFKIKINKVKGLKINSKLTAQFPLMIIEENNLELWIKENEDKIKEFIGKQEDSELPIFRQDEFVYGDPAQYSPSLKTLPEVAEVPFDIPSLEDEEEELF